MLLLVLGTSHEGGDAFGSKHGGDQHTCDRVKTRAHRVETAPATMAQRSVVAKPYRNMRGAASRSVAGSRHKFHRASIEDST